MSATFWYLEIENSSLFYINSYNKEEVKIELGLLSMVGAAIAQPCVSPKHFIFSKISLTHLTDSLDIIILFDKLLSCVCLDFNFKIKKKN